MPCAALFLYSHFATVERNNVCDTEDTLRYLSVAHSGELNQYFTEKSIDEITEEISGRNPSATRVRREVLMRDGGDANDISKVDQRQSTTDSSPVSTVPTRAGADSSTGGSATTAAPTISSILFKVSHSAATFSTSIILIMFIEVSDNISQDF